MSTIGPHLLIVGEVLADEDIVIAGRVEGPVVCERASVVLLDSAEVVGDIIGRDITVHGRVTGRLMATEFVDLVPTAVVTGAIMTPRFVLADGASFHGRVEPQHLEAALRVFKFEREKRAAPASATAQGA
jgi:cytoskeletal protein CcmA (bactofilin family)